MSKKRANRDVDLNGWPDSEHRTVACTITADNKLRLNGEYHLFELRTRGHGDPRIENYDPGVIFAYDGYRRFTLETDSPAAIELVERGIVWAAFGHHGRRCPNCGFRWTRSYRLKDANYDPRTRLLCQCGEHYPAFTQIRRWEQTWADDDGYSAYLRAPDNSRSCDPRLVTPGSGLDEIVIRLKAQAALAPAE